MKKEIEFTAVVCGIVDKMRKSEFYNAMAFQQQQQRQQKH